MNVLSVFDGISAGMIALEKSSINVANYYSSEIDKYAIKISQKNYPNIIRLGDITNWKNWVLPEIDLLIGGSPCQGFSFAGKQLNFNDPRSALFFEFVNILKHIKPKYFLLENVIMKQEYQDVISNLLGAKPIMINSSLFSAQSRKRLYWTNIPNITQPIDNSILIKDILETSTSSNINNYFKCGILKSYYQNKNISNSGMCLIGEADGIKGKSQWRRVYSPDGKSPTATAICGGHQEIKINTSETTWRKLTPLEVERLQTFPDNYTQSVSNYQRYKMLGNSWTVDVISHIFKGLL